MLDKIIKTIHRLRILVLCFLIVGFFYYLGESPIQLGQYLGARFSSAVGMSVSVPENPVNKLALELQQKENSLTQKEQELNAREQALNESNNNRQSTLIMVLGAGIAVLFVLVILNYILDYRRRRREKN